jgi:hypothetical protein
MSAAVCLSSFAIVGMFSPLQTQWNLDAHRSHPLQQNLGSLLLHFLRFFGEELK